MTSLRLSSDQIQSFKTAGYLIFREPLLIEMLLCPVMWYGNAREDDMDWGQFCIMFRALYLEGMGRPYAAGSPSGSALR